MTQIQGNFRSMAEAVEFFRQKVNLPTRTWSDLVHGQHARAFVVAGATRDELLTDLRDAVDKAIANGESLGKFQKRFGEIVKRHGWSYNGSFGWRSRIIYQTNLRTSYMSGKYKQLTDPDMLQLHPFWEYRHNSIINPRETHQAWGGKIFAANDPWWRIHYPPNGWGCQCDVLPVSKRRMRELGKDGPDPTPATNDDDPPPEWRYNVGEAAWGNAEGQRLLAQGAGEPMTTIDDRDWKTFNRPEKVPFDPPVATVGEQTRDERVVRESFMALFGTQTVLKDPTGARVSITDAIVDHWAEKEARFDGREQFLPFVEELVTNPFEIWVGFTQGKVSGRTYLRKRYIKGIRVDKDRTITLIADAIKGQWVSFDFFRGDQRGLRNSREGWLVYGRPVDEGGP